MFSAKRVAQDFSAAASHYDDHALVQQRVLSKLISKIHPHLPTGGAVLDAGCGTGQLARKMAGYKVTQIDIAYAMCAHAAPFGAATVNGTLESLPFADNSFNGVVCSLALQWIDKQEEAIAEMFRVLRSGGTLAISTFGPNTLKELRESFATIDAYRHVSPFDIPGGFTERENYTEYYPTLLALMRHLRAIGARNKLQARRRSLMTRRQMHRLKNYYETHFMTPSGLRVTWDVRTMIAVKP